jgi:SAM-dependent methyltransferase
MSGCEGYEAIARVYDKLNADIDYEKWADFFERCFDKYLDKKPQIVLDLACGTGRMTRVLAARGYDMIGVDGSADMLSRAMEEGREGILYLLQDMRELELYGTVGATVCCLDSINYLLENKDIEKVFSLVHNYLDPDGLFLFDVNTPYKFEHVYGDNAYILEDESEDGMIFCGWQNQFDAESGICDFYLSVFRENAEGSYEREDEHQRERCYALSTLQERLQKNGFEFLGCFGDFAFGAPEESCERWYVAARAKKN